MVTRDQIIKQIKDFLKADRERHLPLGYFENFARQLSGNIQDAKVDEHILKHSKKGKCNKVFLAELEEFIDKTGCGSYGEGMPCVCNEPKGHEGNCVCGECGERW